MALTAYMSVKGNSQGDIKGDCPQSGDKKDKILLYNIDHNVEIPKDTHTGLPTGQRIHQPFTVTKHKDQSSPKLFQACCKGEQCTVEILYFRIKDTGEEENYFIISKHIPAFTIVKQLIADLFGVKLKACHTIVLDGRF